jgi:hypothetical protein
MLSLTVQIEDSASAALRRVMARVEDAEGLHDAIAQAVEDGVRQHIADTKQSPNTGWWGRAARMISHTATATEAVVSLNQRGVALRYHGGRVLPVRAKALAIPHDTVPVADGTRKAPREMGLLAFLPARRPARKGVIGVLVEAEMRTATRGKNKGQPYKVPKPGGKLYYTLMTEVTHKPDPTVLPSDEAMLATAQQAASDYLSTFD